MFVVRSLWQSCPSYSSFAYTSTRVRAKLSNFIFSLQTIKQTIKQWKKKKQLPYCCVKTLKGKDNNSTAVIKHWIEKSRKRYCSSSTWDRTTFYKQLRERRPMKRGVSRQVRERRQKRESYIYWTSPDVVCCHLLICMDQYLLVRIDSTTRGSMMVSACSCSSIASVLVWVSSKK